MTWNSCPGVLSFSKEGACILTSSPSPSSIPAISPRSFFRMVGISCRANLFCFCCLHLPKGDYKQGHGQAPRPHRSSLDLGDLLQSPYQRLFFLAPYPLRNVT